MTKEIDRFWASVEKTSSCWNWLGEITWCGYGRFSRTESNVRTRTGAHRKALELTFGKIQEGLFVCHKCDNRRCVRPDHLFLGTQKDNLSDMVQKGRSAKGETHGRYTKPGRTARRERHGRALLTEQQVIEIRQRYAVGDITLTNLAKDYAVCRSQVWNITSGNQWVQS
jgi:hypothetical protein